MRPFAAMFDDDLYSNVSAEELSMADEFEMSGLGAGLSRHTSVFDFGGGPETDINAADKEASLSSLSMTSSRRRRGARGSGHGKKWQSGHIPPPPSFSGDIENDPFCLRHYKRVLKRWTTITCEYLPKNEQALRALDALTGDAALELEEIEDSRYNVDNGIDLLLQDLSESFGEKEIFRKGGLIREFESMVRVQGESVTAFVRRFRLMERKLKDAKIPQYPSETRAVKLLDGLKLDERATSQLLLAAGNRYEFQALVDAIRVQYPPGLTLTGLSRSGLTLSGFGRASSSSSMPGRSRGRGTSVSSFRSRGTSRAGSSKWKSWTADALDEGLDDHETYMTAIEENGDDGEWTDENGFDYQYDEEDGEGDQPTDDPPAGDGEAPQADGDDVQGDHQALTATSKRLASAVQSRGYYTTAAKGKNKGTISGGKGKDKGQAKKSVSFSQIPGKNQMNLNKGKGKGVTGKTTGKGLGSQLTTVQRQRLESSLCIGCGAADHWLRDCPNVSQHQAHICSSQTTLDGEGAVVWMVNQEEPSRPTSSAALELNGNLGHVNLDQDAAKPDTPQGDSPRHWSPTASELSNIMACLSPRPGSDAGAVNPDDFADQRMADDLFRDEMANIGRQQSPVFDVGFSPTGSLALCLSPRQNSDFGDLNPDDWRDHLESTSFFQEAYASTDWQDPDVVAALNRAQSIAQRDLYRPVFCDHETQEQTITGEDPRTSRALVENQKNFQNEKIGQQEQGEDLRTSKSRKTTEGSNRGDAGVGSLTLASQAPSSSSLDRRRSSAMDECQLPLRPAVKSKGKGKSHGEQFESKGKGKSHGKQLNEFSTVLMLSSSPEPSSEREAVDLNSKCPIFKAPQLLVQYSDEPCFGHC